MATKGSALFCERDIQVLQIYNQINGNQSPNYERKAFKAKPTMQLGGVDQIKLTNFCLGLVHQWCQTTTPDCNCKLMLSTACTLTCL